MKRSGWIAAIVAVGLLVACWPAHAQVGNDGTKYTAATGTRLIGVKADSTQKLLQADDGGRLRVMDESGQQWTYYSRMFSDTLSTAGKNADSSGVYPVPNVKRRALLVYPFGVTAVAGTAMHVALEIRAHWQQSSDSSSTFTYARYAGANARWPTGVTAAADSIGHVGSIPLPATSGAAGTVTPSEVVLTVRPDVNQMLTKGLMIPIPDDFGPYLSVRLRVLDQLTSTGGAGLKRGRFDITLVGSPQ